MTRSGLYDSPPALVDVGLDPNASGDYSTTDMVNRLDPRTLRWLESSPAEQEFLGCSLAELRRKSFLEIVHPDDRARVAEQICRRRWTRGRRTAWSSGSRPRQGKPKAIEINVGVRYATDMSVTISAAT